MMGIPFWDPIELEGVDISKFTIDGGFGYGDGPEFSSNPWEVVSLGGNKLPGLWKVKGLPTLAVDAKKSSGTDGATITVHGYLPGPIELEGLLWTERQFQTFLGMVPGLWRKPTKKSKLKELAISISHPGLDVWGINQVVVLGVSVPEEGPIPQSKIIKIKAVEYVPATKQNHTKTAKGGPIVPVDIHIERSKNHGGEPPSATDTGPTGPKKDKSPGST